MFLRETKKGSIAIWFILTDVQYCLYRHSAQELPAPTHGDTQSSPLSVMCSLCQLLTV